jgi:hypothetical protein
VSPDDNLERPRVRALEQNINQSYPFEYRFVDKTFAKTYLEQLKQKKLVFYPLFDCDH